MRGASPPRPPGLAYLHALRRVMLRYRNRELLFTGPWPTRLLGRKTMQRYGMVIKVKPEMLEEYKRLHANPWPDVLKMIAECNIRNYSIYHKDGWLFSYFEYHGDEFEADMAKMAADPLTQKWWAVCKPCQEPLETRAEGEWWADMEELFHCD